MSFSLKSKIGSTCLSPRFNPKVIAVAAVSGGGKTTVTRRLAEVLKAGVLFFDDYDLEGAPEDFIQWVSRGADYNVWNVVPIISDIHRISSSQEGEVPPYIILDYPFSYLNDKMKAYLDLSIYIDTPLDVAMARRMLRDHRNSEIVDIHNDLKFYLEAGRVAYLEMENKIKPDADAVVDGTLPVEHIVELVRKEIRDRGL